jgi:hypothetical protein
VSVASRRNPNGKWVPVVPSPSGTVITAGTKQSIWDASGNVWTLPSTGIISVNGVPDLTTWAVKKILYQGGVIWQYSGAPNWYCKVVPLWSEGAILTDNAGHPITDDQGQPILTLPNGLLWP